MLLFHCKMTKMAHCLSNSTKKFLKNKTNFNSGNNLMISVYVHSTLVPMLLRRQSSEGFRFNPDCRQVTIQEYLTLVPGHG